jgi:DNA-binding CsgD family transcriptional regulator
MHPSDVGSPSRSVSAITGRPHTARPASPSIAATDLGREPAANRQRPWPLTRRETEVLAEMASGKTNAAIAQVLFISRKAVEKHVNSIFSKMLLVGRDEHHPRIQVVLMYLAQTQTDGAAPWSFLPPGPDRRTLTSPRARPRHHAGSPGSGPRCRQTRRS